MRKAHISGLSVLLSLWLSLFPPDISGPVANALVPPDGWGTSVALAKDKDKDKDKDGGEDDGPVPTDGDGG